MCMYMHNLSLHALFVTLPVASPTSLLHMYSAYLHVQSCICIYMYVYCVCVPEDMSGCFRHRSYIGSLTCYMCIHMYSSYMYMCSTSVRWFQVEEL